MRKVPKIVGIYKITNNITGQFYIGSAWTAINERWWRHKKDLRTNNHHSPRLQNSWNKYGENSFEFSIIEECSRDMLIEREQFYIDTLNPFFNICLIAGNCAGRKFSEESKKKMSLSAKRRGLNEHLIAQQKSKAVYNELGQRKCTCCLEFKDNFVKKRSICKNCFNATRPSRRKEINEYSSRN